MTDDTIKKKRGRSKLFRSCFQSTGADENNFDHRNFENGRLGKPVLIAVNGKHFISDVDSVDSDVSDSKRSSSSRRRFSRMLKAVLFNTAMAKKIRRSSSKSSMASTKTSLSFSSEKTGKSFNESNQYNKEYTDFDDSASRRSYLSSVVSTSSSSVNSNSLSSRADSLEYRHHPVTSNWLSSTKPKHTSSIPRSCLDQKASLQPDSRLRHQVSLNSVSSTKSKPVNSISRYASLDSSLRNPVSSNLSEKIKSNGYNLNIRLCLFVLVSLFVLVFWGRIFSILCTSIWFYFVPCRRVKPVDSVMNATECVDVDSEQYKKRVIMAGLLERNRNPVQ